MSIQHGERRHHVPDVENPSVFIEHTDVEPGCGNHQCHEHRVHPDLARGLDVHRRDGEQPGRNESHPGVVEFATEEVQSQDAEYAK